MLGKEKSKIKIYFIFEGGICNTEDNEPAGNESEDKIYEMLVNAENHFDSGDEDEEDMLARIKMIKSIKNSFAYKFQGMNVTL